MDNKEIAKQLGSSGGKKSAEKRLGGKTPEERSRIMSNVRLSKEAKRKMDIVENAFMKSLKENSENQF